MTEVILNPGETIYVPSSVGHAVLNLDAETLALTEKPMVITSAIEELPLFHGNGYISFLIPLKNIAFTFIITAL